jgi:hypothetical protein
MEGQTKNTTRIVEKIDMTSTNVRWIALQPLGSGPVEPTILLGENANFAATVSPTPRTLHELKREHKFGITGRKAATYFAAQERGRVKHKHTRRKVAWDKIGEMVRGGLDCAGSH